MKGKLRKFFHTLNQVHDQAFEPQHPKNQLNTFQDRSPKQEVYIGQDGLRRYLSACNC